MNQISMLLAASILGGLVGGLIAFEIMRRSLTRVFSEQPAQEQLQVECIKLICNIQARDGRTLMTGGFSTDYQELSAVLVERWLEKRDLVMAPKGKDFKAKATS